MSGVDFEINYRNAKHQAGDDFPRFILRKQWALLVDLDWDFDAIIPEGIQEEMRRIKI